MEEQNKGCVYFFRHIGLSPIKIGYSENHSPIKRFDQFKTYAPFGAELIGFIMTYDAKKLETELHKKYARDRVKGEWFEITKEEAEKCISFHSNIFDVEEKNRFEIAWAKKVIIPTESEDYKLFFNVFSLEPTEESIEVKLTTDEICNELNMDKFNLRKIFRKLDIKCGIFKIKGQTTSAYVLYKKIS